MSFCINSSRRIFEYSASYSLVYCCTNSKKKTIQNQIHIQKKILLIMGSWSYVFLGQSESINSMLIFWCSIGSILFILDCCTMGSFVTKLLVTVFASLYLSQGSFSLLHYHCDTSDYTDTSHPLTWHWTSQASLVRGQGIDLPGAQSITVSRGDWLHWLWVGIIILTNKGKSHIFKTEIFK